MYSSCSNAVTVITACFPSTETCNNTAATCLANEWIRSLIANFGDGTAETNKKCKHTSSWNKEPVDSVVENWLSAVVQVHNNTAQSIQSNASIIKCKRHIVCEF